MKLSLGIVGLPNVGKSTLFNALTKNEIAAENYPFCTIDPNVGIVPVHDEILPQLAELENSAETIPAVVEFVDIAGLVKGASKGEGLGNKFLSNIREVAAIVHVVRSFHNDDILHVEDSVDPLRDIEIIETELILKDLETLDSRLQALDGKARAEKSQRGLLEYMQQLKSHLDQGELAYSFEHSENEDIQAERKQMQLLTDKPVLYVVNTEIDKRDQSVELLRARVSSSAEILPLDIKLEAEIASLSADERQEYIEEFGLEATGLESLTQSAYQLLNLISFYTAGEKEARAWTISKGETAPEAAGAIHTDFTKNFIAADIIPAADFIAAGGWKEARENGQVRLEGKDYVMQDQDVVLFKVNT